MTYNIENREYPRDPVAMCAELDAAWYSLKEAMTERDRWQRQAERTMAAYTSLLSDLRHTVVPPKPEADPGTLLEKVRAVLRAHS